MQSVLPIVSCLPLDTTLCWVAIEQSTYTCRSFYLNN